MVSSNAVTVFGVDLQPCSTRAYAFNSCTQLPLLGKFSALIESKCSVVDAKILGVESESSLRGYIAATELGILHIANAVSVEKNIFQQYPSLFTGRGKMKNPFHQRKSLMACVEPLLQRDIIEPTVFNPQGVSCCFGRETKVNWWCSFVPGHA